jgi:hypothetical protein
MSASSIEGQVRRTPLFRGDSINMDENRVDPVPAREAVFLE